MCTAEIPGLHLLLSFGILVPRYRFVLTTVVSAARPSHSSLEGGGTQEGNEGGSARSIRVFIGRSHYRRTFKG